MTTGRTRAGARPAASRLADTAHAAAPLRRAGPSDLLASFFAAAICALLLAAGAAIASTVTGLDWLHWTAVHLALLGGVSQFVLGPTVLQLRVPSHRPTSRRLIGAQLLAWNAGTALVVVGVPTATTPLVNAGGCLLAVGLSCSPPGCAACSDARCSAPGGRCAGIRPLRLPRARWPMRKSCSPATRGGPTEVCSASTSR